MRSRKICHIVAAIVSVLGLLTVIGGVLLIVLGDDWIAAAVKKGCRLEPGTTVYKLWRDSPVPMYAHIYVFDLVNGSAFLDGSKPIVRQRGPFVYKEERTKVDVERNPNRTISYNETRQYTFQPDLSAEAEDVTITTINIVYMTLINYLREKDVPNVVRKIIGDVLPVAKEQVLMKLTVKEFLWGYKDPILAKLVSFASGFFTMDMVSIYNASVSGAGLNRFLINDGVDFGNETNRIDKLGWIEGFNFADQLNIWSDEYANQINGTDSTLWHPTVSQEERIYTFISDICRSVYLNFNETRENQFDIDTYRFVLPDRVFSNASENRGFCLFDSALNRTKCLASGLFSLSSCVKMSGSSLPIQLPIIASSPHFLGADPLVRDAVEGLNPDDKAHRSYMDVEPITGIVMNGSRRLQINFNIINDSQIPAIKNLIPIAFPMIWLDEHAEIDSGHADDFRHEVYLPMNLVNYAKYVLPSVGAFLMILVGSIYLYRWYRTRNRDSAFPSADPDERTPLRS